MNVIVNINGAFNIICKGLNVNSKWWADLDCRRAFRLNEENGNIEELDGAEKIKKCIS